MKTSSVITVGRQTSIQNYEKYLHIRQTVISSETLRKDWLKLSNMAIGHTEYKHYYHYHTHPTVEWTVYRYGMVRYSRV